jgi:antitoxin MazE
MSTIQKWGNSLAVRIPKEVARRAEVEVGTQVEILAEKGAIVLRPAKRPRYRLADLLENLKPRQLHGEVDFGPDVGRERID